MKKFITILALALVVSLCASFAVSAETITGLSNASENATVTYTAASDSTEKVYSVDVTWNDVAFSYNAGENTWNPSEHAYTGASGSWGSDNGTVTVTNHSNAAVTATLSFTKAADNGNVTMTFSDGGVINLDTAEDTDVNDAPTGTVTLTPGGTPAKTGTIGTVKVTITAGN